MFYLDQQCCQVACGMRGHRPYCTWGLGLQALWAGSAQGQSCRCSPLLLAALMLWQQGKQKSKDTMGPNGAFTDGRRVGVLSDFSVDNELTFLGKSKLRMETGIKAVSVVHKE